MTENITYPHTRVVIKSDAVRYNAGRRSCLDKIDQFLIWELEMFYQWYTDLFYLKISANN